MSKSLYIHLAKSLSHLLYSAVVKTLRESYPPRTKQGFVLCLTGLHNSGKDTIAKALQVTLNQQGGRSISLLLGDGIRPELDARECSNMTLLDDLPTELCTAYSKTAEEHSKDIQRLAFVSSELARAGAAVITSPTAPRAAARDALRESVLQSAGPGGNFFTIHVSTPLAHCETNDRTGIYKRARAGELCGVAGVDEEFEAPSKADLTVDLTKESVSEAVTSEFYIWC